MPSSVEDAAQYIEDLQRSVILTEENRVEFKALFENVFPDFFSELSREYDDLSPAEVRLPALQRLDLPGKDMVNMLGISTDSIKKARYRLRKKHPDLLDAQSQFKKSTFLSANRDICPPFTLFLSTLLFSISSL